MKRYLNYLKQVQAFPKILPFDETAPQYFKLIPEALVREIMTFLADDPRDFANFGETNKKHNQLEKDIIDANIEQFIFITSFENAYKLINRFRTSTRYQALKTVFEKNPQKLLDWQIIQYALTTEITAWISCERLDQIIENLNNNVTIINDQKRAKSLALTSLFIKRNILITEGEKLDQTLSPEAKCKALKENLLVANLIQTVAEKTKKNEVEACTALMTEMYQNPLFLTHPISLSISRQRLSTNLVVSTTQKSGYFFVNLAGANLSHFNFGLFNPDSSYINIENTNLHKAVISPIHINTSLLSARSSEADIYNKNYYANLNRFFGENGIFVLKNFYWKFFGATNGWTTAQKIQLGILLANHFISAWEEELRTPKTVEETLSDLENTLSLTEEIKNILPFALDQSIEDDPAWTQIFVSQCSALLFWKNNIKNNKAHTWEGRDILEEYKQKLITRKSNQV